MNLREELRLRAIHEVLVELFVLLIGDFAFVPRPNSLHEIQSLVVDADGVVDEVRVLLHDLASLLLVTELIAVVLHVQNYSGASFEAWVRGLSDFVSAAAV